MEKTLIFVAIACFFGAVGLSMWRMSRGVRAGRWGGLGFFLILVGFAVLTFVLFERGRLEGSCPLNSLYDVLLFQGWALVLIYLVVGPSYRLSYLGAFTAPVAAGVLLAAQVLPISRELVRRESPSGWVEAHAGLSLIAYGAFGLAGINGVMYLLQERQLKSHKFSRLMVCLPPIQVLADSTKQLLVFGFVLLSASFFSGWMSGLPVNEVKLAGSLGIWLIYGLILGSNRFWPWPAGRVELAAALAFGVALGTLPVVQFLSSAK